MAFSPPITDYLSLNADTSIVPVTVKLALAGIPLTPIPRIAGAILRSATDPNPESSGCPWMLPDEGPVFRLERENLTTGVYELINARAARAKGYILSFDFYLFQID